MAEDDGRPRSATGSNPPPSNQPDDTLWERDVFKAVDAAVADAGGDGAPSLIPISPIPFGKYVLVAQLGTSGLSHLLLAVARGDGGFRKLVVVKRLRPIFASEPDRVTDFFAEARLGARVQHPNIVQTLESGTHSGQPFMVMEHLEGQTLDRLLRRRARAGKHLPLPLLSFVAQQMLMGLSYVHTLDDFDGKPLRLVLRDVSPSNIIVTYGGEVKLLNFGVSTPVAGSTETSPSWQQGKFSYYAPEQVEGFADQRTDLFAVGVFLWEGLMARPLFSATSPAETLLQVQRAEVPPAQGRDIPPTFTAIVQKALARRADDRFQDAASFRAALQEFAFATQWHFSRDDLADFMEEDFADLRDRYGITMRQCVCDGMAELARQSSPPASSLAPPPASPVPSSMTAATPDTRRRAEPTERFRRSSGAEGIDPRRSRRTTSTLPPAPGKMDPRFVIAALAIGIPLWLIAIALFVQFLR